MLRPEVFEVNLPTLTAYALNMLVGFVQSLVSIGMMVSEHDCLKPHICFQLCFGDRLVVAKKQMDQILEQQRHKLDHLKYMHINRSITNTLFLQNWGFYEHKFYGTDCISLRIMPLKPHQCPASNMGFRGLLTSERKGLGPLRFKT